MALSLEVEIAKVKHYFAHDWTGGSIGIADVIEILGTPTNSGIVMKVLGDTPEFVRTDSGNALLARLHPSPESGIKPLVFSDSEAPRYLEAVRSVVPDMGDLTAYAIAEAVIKASRE